MIGTAFHSVLFAVQATVPVIAINYAPKVRNFMDDVGLARFVLEPHEHGRLPELVAEMLDDQPAITAELHAARQRLCEEAQQNLQEVRRQIEANGPRHDRSGPKVSVIVRGSGNRERDERTLASCAAQSYQNVEILFSAPAGKGTTAETTAILHDLASSSSSLQESLTQATGPYMIWVDGGDWFADDALDCLVNWLEEASYQDMVYADYYFMSEKNLPIGHHKVPGPEKLFRRDVVGPCFLARKVLLDDVELTELGDLVSAYALWLRTKAKAQFRPFHAPLLYSQRDQQSQEIIEQEREIRRLWRQQQPAWNSVFWQVADTELIESLIMKPGMVLLRKLGGERAEHK
jgi:hypothetical protein